MTDLSTTLRNELRLLWAAHRRVGLEGEMCLYSLEVTRPWPAKTQGLTCWFGPEGIDEAVAFFIGHYNNGTFPFTPLLLNPVVHRQNEAGEYVPVGSGVYWTTALTVAPVAADKVERVRMFHAAAGFVGRGDSKQSGVKTLAFAAEVLRVEPQPVMPPTVSGSRALYELADIEGEDYWPYYLLGGVSYISNAGSYQTPSLADMLGDTQWDAAVSDEAIAECIARHTVTLKTIQDAAICWERYDRHPGLYARFGNNVAQLEENLRLFNYCARDFELFDSVGPGAMKVATGDDGGFEFLVHGLIPRGSIVLLAGTGGTGKSSIAHKLCCLVATDWREDEQPLWLGQPVVKSKSKGICVYFSGEDGPAIINARNEIFDPEKRAERLMFQRNHFTNAKGEDISFAEFLARLRTMPDVPLLVIDPARKYLTGDEDDSAVVSEFFEAIEAFAHEKNAAVIVVHHLSKGAKPQSARDVLDELRGSQVFIDRPRVVIGMFREGPKTIVGLGKCNIPPSLGMVTTERVFAHNPKTLDLMQLPGPEGVRGVYVPPSEEAPEE